jgi:hypothetical protein
MPVLRLLLAFVLTTAAAAAQPASSVAASPPRAGSVADRTLLISTGTTVSLAQREVEADAVIGEVQGFDYGNPSVAYGAPLLPSAVGMRSVAPQSPGSLSPAVAVGVPVALTAAAIGVGLAADVDDGQRAVLIVLGAALGPSAGNLIQGEWADAGIGLGLRAGGAALMLGGAAGSFWNESDAQRAVLGGVAITGGLVSLSGVVYDVVTAGRNAHARRVRVAPAGAGLAVSVRL